MERSFDYAYKSAPRFSGLRYAVCRRYGESCDDGWRARARRRQAVRPRRFIHDSGTASGSLPDDDSETRATGLPLGFILASLYYISRLCSSFQR